MEEPKFQPQLILGVIIVSLSIIALTWLSYTIVDLGKLPGAELVLSSLLPLIGTWVGAVMAYYFGKGNYEAASKTHEKVIETLASRIN